MIRRMVLCIFILVAAVGCSLVQPTGDKATDVEAVQNFIPDLPDYNKNDADNIVDALSSVAGGTSLLSGNPLVAAAVAKIDDMIQCYQNVGAVTAQVYTQKTFDITNPQPPAAGVLAIINQDRLRDNFLSCALSSGNQAFSAQSVTLEPCVGSGSFVVNNETITYLYAATMPSLCTAFAQHFASFSGQSPK
jgi:hypothetical protein